MLISRTEFLRGVKVALKNLHCYICGGIIPQGERYVRKDFVKIHYLTCPERKPGESSSGDKPAGASHTL
jgi:hypothetical protein